MSPDSAAIGVGVAGAPSHPRRRDTKRRRTVLMAACAKGVGSPFGRPSIISCFIARTASCVV